MTKLIGLKEVQKNTKYIREEVEKGVNFIVLYRSKPLFEIKPISQDFHFTDELETSGVYNAQFIKKMKEAEKNIAEGKTKTFTSTEDFLASLE